MIGSGCLPKHISLGDCSGGVFSLTLGALSENNFWEVKLLLVYIFRTLGKNAIVLFSGVTCGCSLLPRPTMTFRCALSHRPTHFHYVVLPCLTDTYSTQARGEITLCICDLPHSKRNPETSKSKYVVYLLSGTRFGLHLCHA